MGLVHDMWRVRLVFVAASAAVEVVVCVDECVDV